MPLTKMIFIRHKDIQNNETQYNDRQNNGSQHIDIHQNYTNHNDIQHKTTLDFLCNLGTDLIH
jgi:hypothetical protein